MIRMPHADMPRSIPLRAHLSALAGLPVSSALHDLLRERGVEVVAGMPDASSTSLGVLDFPLIWVGDRWNDAVDYLAQVAPREVRERCIVIGRSPPADMGPRIRSVGALTYAACAARAGHADDHAEREIAPAASRKSVRDKRWNSPRDNTTHHARR